MEEDLTCSENDSEERRAEISYLTDFELRTEDGHNFPVHKASLALKSNYFLSMFCDFERENKNILIKGVSGDTLSNILSYIYTGQICLDESNFRDILVASDYLLLDDILSLMKSDLGKHLTLDSCLAIFTAARSVNQVDIAKESFRFVETHFEQIVSKNSRKILDLPPEELKMLLNDRNLCVSSERNVWLAIVEWVEAHLPSSLPLVPEFLTSLAIGEVGESLASEILNHSIVANNKICESISGIKSIHPRSDSKILQYFIQDNPGYKSRYTRRSPPNLRFISRHSACHYTVYVTYDNRIDLWREVLSGDASRILIMNASIYEFKSKSVRRFSVPEKKWYQCRSLVHEHYSSRFVGLGRLIYELGPSASSVSSRVAFYDPEVDIWYGTTPMFSIHCGFRAAVLGECIYVVGIGPQFNLHEMVAQVYDSRTQRWTLLPVPSTYRCGHRAVAYHGKIYVIGGENEDRTQRKDAEVFDPTRGVWSIIDMPFSYAEFQTYIFDDRLIVSGDQTGDCVTGHL